MALFQTALRIGSGGKPQMAEQKTANHRKDQSSSSLPPSKERDPTGGESERNGPRPGGSGPQGQQPAAGLRSRWGTVDRQGGRPVRTAGRRWLKRTQV